MTNFVTTKRALLTSVLSLTLCFAMLLGTTFAWFTDTVTSGGNVIQTGDLDVEMYFKNGTEDPSTAADWKNADGKAIFNYDNWEPGYADAKHIKIVNAGTLAFDWMLRITSSDVVGKLAEVIDVYYFSSAKACASSVAEGVYTRVDLTDAARLGTLEEVMNTTHNISDDVHGTLYSTENVPENGKTETVFTLVLVMQESAGDEYQNLSIGSDLSIEVFATQVSHEEDSFGPDYDANLPSMEVPAAYVRELEEDEIIFSKLDPSKLVLGKGLKVESEGKIEGPLTLDTAYQFLPTEEISGGIYSTWHADYVVSMNDAIAADSVALSGYYDVFGTWGTGHGWVTLAGNAGDTIAANEEIRLLKVLMEGTNVNYQMISDFGNDGIGFLCGAKNLSVANEGKTLTVELRIYETLEKPHEAHTREDGTYCNGATANCETGNYITIGEFKYTFGKYIPDSIPTAKVTRETQYENNASIEWGNYGSWSPTEGLEANLDAAFEFTAPDDATSVATSPYKDWECDYVVSLDRDLGENKLFLGGNYGTFGWIGFHNGDVTPKANEEIYLLGSVTTNPWTYEDVVTGVGTFLCGVGDVDGALAGATFTVHLRLTNPETGEHFDVNTVTYTFGGDVVMSDIYDVVE